MAHTWRYIEENDVTAHYGLATDENLMKPYVENAKSEHQATLRLYNYNDHCALVGRFQNMNAELDLESCTRQDIEFGRRQTGGGAIIMGKDQLGLCVTCSSKAFPWTNIRDLCYLFSKPVIDALSKLGINAEFRAKNDLEVNGKKIAGLGVYIDPHGAIQFHLSLLLDLDILKMLSILQIPIQKYSDKRKVSAVSQRMATVSGEIGRAISHEEIRTLICKSFETHFEVRMDHSKITSQEKTEITRLVSDKYSTEDWIYQQTPQADLTGMSLVKTPLGLLRIYIGLKGEVIKSVLITGDFIEHEQLFKQIEAELKWSPLDKEKILKVVTKVLQHWLNLSSSQLEPNGTEKNALPLWRGEARRTQGEENLKMEEPEMHPASRIPDAQALTTAIFLAAQKAYNANEHTYQGTCYYPKRESLNTPTV
ncbi:MAG: hypothetical protein DRI69_12100 [Bacteroidetes bacterium]|nr:MAG: hypothetical protein DRI69_12100 [Bacteroidota bacterium]